MEVAAAPTVGLKEHAGLPASRHGEKEKDDGRRSNGFCFVEEESSESSAIGAESSSEGEEECGGGEDEVQSKPKDGAFGSFDSLEESLPIMRGLSNYFTGKSKSFANLSDVSNAGCGDPAKPENPLNKRRRIIMACKSSWPRRASYCSFVTSLPPLTVVDGEDEEEDEEAAELVAAMGGKDDHIKFKKSFRSPRSFSLSDLQRV